jgi:aminobenzoyl-glutamate utilization protein B
MTKAILSQVIDENRQVFTQLSDRIWEYAETRFEEKRSAEDLCQALEAEGFIVEGEAGGVPYAFVGTFGSGEPVIGFLGEYDALSGLSQKADIASREPLVPGANGQGCGHHLLGVGALAAAVAVKR